MNELRFEWDEMRTEYDFSTSKPNPYAKRLKRQVTIRIDVNSLDYFKEQAEEIGLPYQSLINLYLADCVSNQRKLTFT
jgi:predicted DNA binding CopG/RHH family protein